MTTPDRPPATTEPVDPVVPPDAAFLPGLAPLVARYDGFLLDLWGVIHDGHSPYPGAIDCLTRLAAAGRPAVLLSNAPRPGASVARTMAGMGIAADLYAGIVTSGDATRADLIARSDPAFRALGSSCLFIGPDRDHGLLEGTGIERVADPAQATFVLCSGPVALDETEDQYRPVLAACALLGLPMVCPNPDIAVIREGRRVVCAGALARIYADELGGTVLYRGKPDAAVFHRARAALGLAPTARVAMVGDGLETDLPGALAAGLDAVFVAGGLNAQALGVAHGEAAPRAGVRALLAAAGLARPGRAPVAVLPAFVW